MTKNLKKKQNKAGQITRLYSVSLYYNEFVTDLPTLYKS
jgi:hypothetical protein